MNCQREGSNLKTQIRMAWNYLGYDEGKKSLLNKLTIAQLRELNSRLSKEVKKEKDIKSASSFLVQS